MNNLEQGECDKCEGTYDLGSRDNRCGDCGNCGNCCTHKGEGKCLCTDEPPYKECLEHSGY
jgi:hypothetical protein